MAGRARRPHRQSSDEVGCQARVSRLLRIAQTAGPAVAPTGWARSSVWKSAVQTVEDYPDGGPLAGPAAAPKELECQ